MEKLNQNEMEKMLPDYLFGDMKEEDKSLFEYNLQFHPEIQNELNEAKAVFEKVDQLDFNKLVKDRSKNVSVKVMSKLNEPSVSFWSNALKFRNLVPTLGLVVMAYVYFFVPFKTQEQLTAVNNERFFKGSEIVVIDNDIDESNINVVIEEINIGSNYEEVYETLSEDEFQELLEDMDNEDFDI